MSTPTAAIIKTKSEQATQLRAEVQTLGQEVTKLREKLEIAQRTLEVLQSKRQQFTEEAAHDWIPKPGEIAALNVGIDQATIPFEGLTALVNEKQSRLDTVRVNLEALDYELSIATQQASRKVRFDLLKKQGDEVAARIAVKLESIIAEDLPALDAVRDALSREFINVGDRLNLDLVGRPEARAAEAAIIELNRSFFDGSFLRVERTLLRQGWTMRGDIQLTIRNLRAPR